MGRLKKVGKAIGLIAVAILLVGAVVHTGLNYYAGKALERELEALKDSGAPLTPTEVAPPPVPDEENAALLYRKACGNRLKQIGLALHMYATDHDGKFPDKLSQLYPLYISSFRIFNCPASLYEVTKADEIDTNSSYVYYAGHSDKDRADVLVAHDRAGNHGDDGRHELYVNGYVQWVPAKSYRERQPTSP